MKRAFIENKLEQAAKNGDTKKIKELLNEPDAVQVTSSMGAFQPEEATFFICQSIHKAQQSCTEGGILTKRKISIPILVAVICILCTVGAYAGNRFTHKFFIKNGVVQYEVTRVDLTPEEKEALNHQENNRHHGHAEARSLLPLAILLAQNARSLLRAHVAALHRALVHSHLAHIRSLEHALRLAVALAHRHSNLHNRLARRVLPTHCECPLLHLPHRLARDLICEV